MCPPRSRGTRRAPMARPARGLATTLATRTVSKPVRSCPLLSAQARSPRWTQLPAGASESRCPQWLDRSRSLLGFEQGHPVDDDADPRLLALLSGRADEEPRSVGRHVVV